MDSRPTAFVAACLGQQEGNANETPAMADVSPEGTQAVESVPAAELPPEGVVEAAAESGGDDGGPSDAERGELPSGPIDLTSMDFSGDAAALTRDDGHPKDAEKAAECKAKGNACVAAIRLATCPPACTCDGARR